MPVEVVRRQQREHAYRGRHGHVRSLKARDLQDEHVVRVVVVQFCQGTADVAGNSDVEPVSTEGCCCEHHGGRLALGPGHGNNSPVSEVLHEQRGRSRHNRAKPGCGQKALVVTRNPGRVDDEVETAVFEDRRRLHIDPGRVGLDCLARTRETAGVPRNVVDDDQLGASRTDTSSKALTFHACPEYGDAAPGERRDTSYQRHAAMVHRATSRWSRSGQGQGSVAGFTTIEPSGTRRWQP